MPLFKSSDVTKLETVLFIAVCVTMLASIAMCICLFLVLPREWSTNEFVAVSKNYTDLIYECKCEMKKGGGKSEKMSRSDLEGQPDSTFSENKVRNFPYVVSVSIPAYIDAPWEMQFACTGVIVARNWVMTGGICLSENSEWQYLKVRELSDYWSKGGIVHSVISASIDSKKEPLTLKIEFEFSASAALTPIPPQAIRNLMSAGWRQPEVTRKKFEPFLVDFFTERRCWACVPGTIQKVGCDGMTSGKPLIANCNYLHGMQCKTENGSALQFLEFPEHRNEKWWMFLDTTPAESAESKMIYGVVDVNADRCVEHEENQMTSLEEFEQSKLF